MLLGSKLKNGAKLIAQREMFGDTVVLAKTATGSYVTWRMDDNGDCFSGHYFGGEGFAHAISDFQHRYPT